MPAKPRSLFDAYLDAVSLLSRADVHLEIYARDSDLPTTGLTEKLRADIETFLKHKVPTQ